MTTIAAITKGSVVTDAATGVTGTVLTVWPNGPTGPTYKVKWATGPVTVAQPSTVRGSQ